MASKVTVGSLLAEMARAQGDAIAVQQAGRTWTYREFNSRVNRYANWLRGEGVKRGDRVSILSENRHEYLEVEFACAKLGIIAACINWRLLDREIAYCVNLVEPRLVLISPNYYAKVDRSEWAAVDVHQIDEALEERVSRQSDDEPAAEQVDPEDGLLIVYTSGTTGLPKGAVVSHRAMIARGMLYGFLLRVERSDSFVAWNGLFHMAGSDFAIGQLLLGGKTLIVDGFDLEEIGRLVATEKISYMGLQPGMIRRLVEYLTEEKIVPRGMKAAGAMVDLVPKKDVADVTRALNAHYLNSMGSTETGMFPGCGGVLAIGEEPACLSKHEGPYGLLRLVDDDDNDVGIGVPGECIVRGPTLFSGYWRNEAANLEAFRGGWFHMGDVLVRNADGTLDFVERKSAMIKSGGESIYPAEIERALLLDERVADVCVVGRRDDKWGEVPVAFVAKRDPALVSADIAAIVLRTLAGFKKPKDVVFVEEEWFPRSASGKIARRQVKEMYEATRSKE
jgi:acyl-CoA synthetase (AMP-forming)/AMP-acid ligase II